MTYSQKYTLVHFISPVATNTQFHMNNWPIHTTLADVFAIERMRSDIDTKLEVLLSGISPINTIVGEQAMLGTTDVMLLDKTESLIALHTAIVDLLMKNGAVFNSPEFTREGYLPHCTVQSSGHANRGDSITIDSISLIDMFSDGDWQRRKVLATFLLKSN